MQTVQKKPTSQSNSTDLDTILMPVEEQMQAVNRFIIKELNSDIALINTISGYIINSGGKRLRPVSLLLAAGACNNTSGQQIALAAIIEFIHTATLLHDDVVDASELRRGQTTANGVWGNQAGVLVGDFLYSRAFQQMVHLDDMKVMDILADTTNTIAEGEVMQLMNSHNASLSEADYFETIQRKTAILFQAACQLGAVVSGASHNTEMNLAEYGLNMGIAFQLIDDVLDFQGDVKVTGKNLGDDLADGKATLPLIRAMQMTNVKNHAFLSNRIQEGANAEELEQIIDIINQTDAVSYTRQHAVDYVNRACKALNNLPDSLYKQSLFDLAQFFISRVY